MGTCLDIDETSAHRSWNMSRIRSRNTTPELLVRSLLHRMGYRFSLRWRELPGKPDIVLPGRRTVVFVHGCFWHRHKGCPNASTPTTRRLFWLKKFEQNMRRDIRCRKALNRLGWSTVVVWECDVMRDPHRVAKNLDHTLHPKGPAARTANLPTRMVLLKIAERRSTSGPGDGMPLHDTASQRRLLEIR